MSSTTQAMLNQSLFDQEQEMQTQMGFLPFPPSSLSSFPPLGSCNNHPSHKSFTINNLLPPPLPSSLAVHDNEVPSSSINLTETLLLSSAGNIKQRDDITSSADLGGPQLLSLQRSSANLWAWGEMNECLSSKRMATEDHLGVAAMKMKKVKSRRKVREPRFCFKTMSDIDVLDDGYKWRKYGQKIVKNTQHPRSYYRCTEDNCRVKKRVERLAEDPRMVITTYEGRHAHSPSHDQEDSSQASSHLNNFFW